MAIDNPKGLHHVEHETGGVDALTTLSAGILLTGSLPDARLSANVPLKNAANVFTADQKIQTAGVTRFALMDTSQPTDVKIWKMLVSLGLMQFAAVNDAESAIIATALALDRSGNAKVGADLYEKGRSTPMGHWIDVPFSAANFIGGSGGTWTVAAGNVRQNAYTLIGKTLIWIVDISGSTITGAPVGLLLTVPGGLSTTGGVQYNPVGFSDGAGSGTGMVQSGGSTQVAVYKTVGGGGFTASGSVILEFTATLRIP